MEKDKGRASELPETRLKDSGKKQVQRWSLKLLKFGIIINLFIILLLSTDSTNSSFLLLFGFEFEFYFEFEFEFEFEFDFDFRFAPHQLIVTADCGHSILFHLPSLPNNIIPSTSKMDMNFSAPLHFDGATLLDIVDNNWAKEKLPKDDIELPPLITAAAVEDEDGVFVALKEEKWSEPAPLFQPSQ